MTHPQDFLAAVLPSQGFRFVVLLFPPEPNGQRKSPTKSFTTDETTDLLGFAGWGMKKGADAYFAVGGFQPGPDGSLARTAATSLLHRCMRLDLDCGAGKDYPDQQQALAALGAFLQATGLPECTLVDSGYGIHVYWPLDADISLAEWLARAEGLKALTQQHGLRCDHTTTLDAARILRIPGTVNFKYGQRKLVRLLHLSPAVPAASFPAAAPANPGIPHGQIPAILMGGGNELQSGMFPPYFLKGVITQCPAMGAMFADQGARAQEPLWKIALDLCNKSDDTPAGREAIARHISKGHPSYSDEGFNTKWAQVQRQDYHPPTCQRMSDMGAPECGTCPHRSTIKSPVTLGRAVPIAAPDPAHAAPQMQLIAAPQQGSIQHGIFVMTPGESKVYISDGPLTKNLRIQGGMPCLRHEIENADGSKGEYWKPIMNYRIVDVERLLDAIGKQAITAFTVDRHKDGLFRIEATNAHLSEPRAFSSLLGAAGLALNKKAISQLQDIFMPEFLAQLQRARAANQIAGKCGWTNDFQGFVLGTRLFTATEEQHIRPAAAVDEMEAYHEAGDPVLWRRAFDIAMAGGPDRQAVIALSIAAPLMAFTGVDGVVLNAHSPESGVGKSTLCDAAISVWGSPQKLRKAARDTVNATWKMAAITGNLPMVVDEFTNVEGKQLSDYIYTVTEGREKHRLTSDSKLNAADARWCLPVIMTSNNSLHDKLQTYRSDATAEAARVFELRMRPLKMSMENTGQLKQDLLGIRTNYGFLGAHLVRMYLGKPQSYWRDIVSARISHWDADVSTDASDRFRAACAALIDIGCNIGISMGLPFNRVEVIRCVRDQWEEQRTEFEAARKLPIDFVNNYIIDNLSDFAIIGGQMADSLISSMPRKFAGEIRGKTLNSKFQPTSIMIPVDLLRRYVREQNGNFKTIMEWMRHELKNQGHVARLGKLVFLDGMFQSINTEAVEFYPSIAGSIALSVVAPGVVPAPLKAVK